MNPKKPKEPKYNVLCTRCRNKCKQAEKTKLMACPNFDAKEIQLEFKFKK
jgi:hypothetical protein